jgi:tetratricopeptide (TPR) repeat protein
MAEGSVSVDYEAALRIVRRYSMPAVAMTRLLRKLALAVLMIVQPVSAAEVSLPKPGTNWIEVRSANFQFFSDAGRLTTRRIAVDLEELRAVLSELTDYKLQAPIPTSIYVFKGDRSFRPYKTLYQGQPATLSGYFAATEDANFIAINADSRDASAVIYHEFVHYVANNNMWYLPVWFSEGLAEFYESFDVSGDTVYIGLPIRRHLIELRGRAPISLEELFAVDYSSELYNESSRRGIFYAQSWALVHYLLLGDEGRRQELNRYLTMVANGVPGDEAFTASFSGDYRSLQRELAGYVRSPRLPWIEATADIDLDKDFQIRKMSYADVLFRLGELLAMQPDRPECRLYFEAAVEADPNHGGALSSLAVEAEKRADWERAGALHRRAADATPEDAFVLYRWGRFLSNRGRNIEMTTSVLARSAELEPSFAPVWALLAKVFADAGVTSEAAVEAARIAHSMQPSDIMAARDLARLYLRLDRRQEAVSLIENSLRSDRRVQAEAWMLVIQQDLLRARELLQDDLTKEAAERVDLADQLVDLSINPEVARVNIDSTRHSIRAHQAAVYLNRAQELFQADDPEGARELLGAALELVDDGPVAASSRRLLDLINHPERMSAPAFALPQPSPTAAEIEHYNQLIASRDFDAALAFLEGMRDRIGVAERKWLDDRVREIRITMTYNRFVDEYNVAVDLYNEKNYDEAIRVLEELLRTLPEGSEAESARELLEDARAARR